MTILQKLHISSTAPIFYPVCTRISNQQRRYSTIVSSDERTWREGEGMEKVMKKKFPSELRSWAMGEKGIGGIYFLSLFNEINSSKVR